MSLRNLLSFTGTLMLFAGAANSWDAGPKQCAHSECTGGVTVDHVLDTQPKYAKSSLPVDGCGAGKDLYGGVCYNGCGSDYHRTAVCTCQKNGGGIFDLWTDCGRFGASGLPSKTCPTGTEYYGGLCYSACPAGSTRTAISTCSHDVKWRSNTHLFVVNRALDLLAKSSGSAVAAKMNVPACRVQWEQGLWDADDGTLSETGGARGSHFYNGAGKDAWGNATKTVTYLMAGIEQIGEGNARTNAQKHLANIGTLTQPTECYQLGLALHYVTDMTQPMHSSSYSALDIPTALHAVFEEYVGNIQGRFTVANVSWDQRWMPNNNADDVFNKVSSKANSLAPGLMQALKYNGTICTMTSEQGVTYTGYCFVGDPTVDAKTGAILQDAYQSTASYLFAAVK